MEGVGGIILWNIREIYLKGKLIGFGILLDLENEGEKLFLIWIKEDRWYFL